MGGSHTANASATYPVSPPVAATLTESVASDKSVYARGENVLLGASVKKSGQLAPAATVIFQITRPDGSVTSLKSTTDSNGYARTTFRPSTRKAGIGGYKVRADASLGGLTATATTSFSVQ